MARLGLFVLFVTFLSLVNGYLITKPRENEVWNFGHRRLIRWTAVNTDPTEITIAIVNMDAGTYPTGMSRIIEQCVRKDKGKYMINSRVFEGLKEGRGYQINILHKDSGSILAQSPQFQLSHKGKDPSCTPAIRTSKRNKARRT
ncbi:hypothetical protein DFH28DRAFT_1102565 [Melampsora americana]|nr:hypothetical protein DFH28DRAFT_1102565 [Melampsora americana]